MAKDKDLSPQPVFPRNISDNSSAGKDRQISARFPFMSAPAHARRVVRKKTSRLLFRQTQAERPLSMHGFGRKNGAGGSPAAPDRQIRTTSDAIPTDKKCQKHGPLSSIVSASLIPLINGQMGTGCVRPHTLHLHAISVLRHAQRKRSRLASISASVCMHSSLRSSEMEANSFFSSDA